MIERFAHFGLSLTKQNFPFLSANRLVHWELVKQSICIGVFAEDAGEAAGDDDTGADDAGAADGDAAGGALELTQEELDAKMLDVRSRIEQVEADIDAAVDDENFDLAAELDTALQEAKVRLCVCVCVSVCVCVCL